MATEYQKRKIREFNRHLLSDVSGVPEAQVTGSKKLGNPPPLPVLGIARDSFMATLAELNEELRNSRYDRSTSVTKTEYADVYDNATKGKVRHYHQMSYLHIGLPPIAAAAKKAATKKPSGI